MTNELLYILKLIAAFLPFALLVFADAKSNLKKNMRSRQYALPPLAAVYSIAAALLMNRFSSLCSALVNGVSQLLSGVMLLSLSRRIQELYRTQGILVLLIAYNTLVILVFCIIKRVVLGICRRRKSELRFAARWIVEQFYCYDETDDIWYVKDNFGHARDFLKITYFGVTAVSFIALIVSGLLCSKQLISQPFYPAFAVIVIGELAFFADGLRKEEQVQELTVKRDNARHVVLYPLLRKPLKELFGDKLSSEGTTINNGSVNGGSVEDILADISARGGHVGENYAAFVRKKIDGGLKPNGDYVRGGYDLAVGKSLLFNTPFYNKLLPYAFYAMNRSLLAGGKILIILGRQGTENDLQNWCRRGMEDISNAAGLWKVKVLDGNAYNEADMPDIGIVTRSGVHDLDIHKENLAFLRKVSFVFIVEPSRLVTTAQIGLNLLIKHCGGGNDITFCSVDRNCDGLVDSLSHILMANITEVSATEYPPGTSSFMCWTADDDYIQHRIMPGVSRYLGIGTELSAVALRNQVKTAMWYGGEAYPVLDAHWIAKQYYYDILDYAMLPTSQESFDRHFLTSFNMCNERSSDYAYVTVEDERFNLFETKRNFATIAQQQGFVNVISPEYMLREYMSENTDLFNADAKAIPYITADYARTRRNSVLSLCLRMCVDGISEQNLTREMMLMGIRTNRPLDALWEEIAELFCAIDDKSCDQSGDRIITSVLTGKNGSTVFTKTGTIRLERRYSIENGKFESIYVVTDSVFSLAILNDLQNACYVAERDSEDHYLGSELKGHIFQKFLPGQMLTLNGKYYEMVSVTSDNHIVVRRASEHINGRTIYRQVRNYAIDRICNSESMGTLKTVNYVDIFYQNADFRVNTPAYWKLGSFNDYENGTLVELNGVPERKYYNKQIIKLDFSRMGDAFTDRIKTTLTALLNEVFVTLFAENYPYISAVSLGTDALPVTYSIQIDDGETAYDKCIFIIEDSQLDLGLLVAFERNLGRIFQIISDYLAWHEEKLAEDETTEEPGTAKFVKLDELAAEFGEETSTKKKNIFARFWSWVKKVLHLDGKKKEKTEKTKKPAQQLPQDDAGESKEPSAEATETDRPDANDVTEAAEADAAACEQSDESESEPQTREMPDDIETDAEPGAVSAESSDEKAEPQSDAGAADKGVGAELPTDGDLKETEEEPSETKKGNKGPFKKRGERK